MGAEVILVPQCEDSRQGQVSGTDLARVDACVERIVKQRGAFRADQFMLDANCDAHANSTGVELLEQAGGNIDAFVEFAGSGGTFTGVARALKSALPGVRCYVVEPRGAAILSGAAVMQPNHRIQGGGYGRSLPLFDAALCDGYLQIDDEEAVVMARRLAKEEGVFSGFSAGANVAAALRLLREECVTGTVACIAADSGLKYLSTDLYP